MTHRRRPPSEMPFAGGSHAPEGASLGLRLDDCRLSIENARAGDVVERMLQAPSLGPLELINLLQELIRRRRDVDHDLRRLIQQAEAIGTLDIAITARRALQGSASAGAEPSEIS